MIITLTGANDFARKAELHKLAAQFEHEYGDMGLERVNGDEAEYSRIQEAITSLPFLASKKMVILHAPSANKRFIEQASELLADIPETTDVIIDEPKLDKRLAYYKYLKKATDFCEYNELDARGLASWLVKAAKQQTAIINSADAAYLVQRVGTNQQLLAHELDKLITFDPKITRATIDLLTEPSPQSTIFELIESAFAGNRKRTLQLYDEQRSQKVEPPQIIAMLTWQLHVLALVKTAGNQGPAEIAKAAHLNPYVVQRSIIAARKLSAEQLKRLVADLLHLDVRLKSESLDADDALKAYLLGI